MAQVTIIICDICGERVLGGECDGTLYPTGKHGKYGVYQIKRKVATSPPVKDICQYCADKIIGIFENGARFQEIDNK